MDAIELKKQPAKARSDKRGRYPASLRQAVIGYAAKRRTQKVTRDAVAAELGMSVATLGYWSRSTQLLEQAFNHRRLRRHLRHAIAMGLQGGRLSDRTST